MIDLVEFRAGEDSGEEGCLVGSQGAGGLVEKVLAGGFYAVDLGAELGDVEVNFEDALFRPHPFDEDGEPGFEGFAEEAAS